MYHGFRVRLCVGTGDVCALWYRTGTLQIHRPPIRVRMPKVGGWDGRRTENELALQSTQYTTSHRVAVSGFTLPWHASFLLVCIYCHSIVYVSLSFHFNKMAKGLLKASKVVTPNYTRTNIPSALKSATQSRKRRRNPTLEVVSPAICNMSLGNCITYRLAGCSYGNTGHLPGLRTCTLLYQQAESGHKARLSSSSCSRWDVKIGSGPICVKGSGFRARVLQV